MLTDFAFTYQPHGYNACHIPMCMRPRLWTWAPWAMHICQTHGYNWVMATHVSLCGLRCLSDRWVQVVFLQLVSAQWGTFFQVHGSLLHTILTNSPQAIFLLDQWMHVSYCIYCQHHGFQDFQTQGFAQPKIVSIIPSFSICIRSVVEFICFFYLSVNLVRYLYVMVRLWYAELGAGAMTLVIRRKCRVF